MFRADFRGIICSFSISTNTEDTRGGGRSQVVKENFHVVAPGNAAFILLVVRVLVGKCFKALGHQTPLYTRTHLKWLRPLSLSKGYLVPLWVHLNSWDMYSRLGYLRLPPLWESNEGCDYLYIADRVLQVSSVKWRCIIRVSISQFGRGFK